MVFEIRNDELKKQMNVLLAMSFKAEDFCPSFEDLDRIDAAVSDQAISGDEKVRILAFLLWVFGTGYQTSENATCRESLQMYLKEHLLTL